MTQPPSDAAPRSLAVTIAHWFWPVLLLLGSTAIVIVWVALALRTNHQNGWMAIPAALNAVLVLRLFGVRRGPFRTSIAVLSTLVIIVAANWLIAASQIGGQLGLYPWQAATKLGPSFVWTLSKLANSGFDVVCLVLAPWTALLATR
ncbi:MAG: hypothetical protein LBV45_01580 [Xanthomonadaceae bacterium]|jgi:hypothetical protein|nr:hypothetical protein [Xanthomonadaceae bacterium]